MKLDFWRHEAREVQLSYPGAEWTEITDRGGPTIALRLTMMPIPPLHELGIVLADLDSGCTVAIHHYGCISHSATCCISLDEHPRLLPNLKLPQQRYIVELVFGPAPKYSSWSAHPKAFVINPEISFRTHPGHPHLYSANGRSWCCPLSPQEKTWQLEPGATVAYLDQVAIWLLKTAVWYTTGGGISGWRGGRWIGPDTSHESSSLLSSIRAADPCWCGSGLCYEACHLRRDLSDFVATRTGVRLGRRSVAG